MNTSVTTIAQTWLTDTFDNETRNEVAQLIANNPQELQERFYKNLEFGTGGMRGIMGVGPTVLINTPLAETPKVLALP